MTRSRQDTSSASTRGKVITAVLSILGTIVGFILSPAVDSWQTYWKAPPVRVKFSMDHPYFYKSRIISESEKGRADKTVYQAYYVEYGIYNRSGWNTAEQCRIFLTSIKHKQTNGEFTKEAVFTPVRLQTAPRYRAISFLPPDISPDMELMATLFQIPEMKFQDAYPDRSGDKKMINLQLAFEADFPPWMESHLNRGTHQITIKIYFKNRKTLTQSFEVVWEPGWDDKDEDMKKRLKVTMLPSDS